MMFESSSLHMLAQLSSRMVNEDFHSNCVVKNSMGHVLGCMTLCQHYAPQAASTSIDRSCLTPLSFACFSIHFLYS